MGRGIKNGVKLPMLRVACAKCDLTGVVVNISRAIVKLRQIIILPYTGVRMVILQYI